MPILQFFFLSWQITEIIDLQYVYPNLLIFYDE